MADNNVTKSVPRLKAAPMVTDETLMIGIGEKGGISVYGLQRFPVTLFREQWERLLKVADEITLYAEEHRDLLSDGKPNGNKAGSKDENRTFKVGPADIAVLTAESARLTAAGDVQGAIKYATLKGVAEANGFKVSEEQLFEIMSLKVGKKA